MVAVVFRITLLNIVARKIIVLGCVVKHHFSTIFPKPNIFGGAMPPRDDAWCIGGVRSKDGAVVTLVAPLSADLGSYVG